MNEFDKRNPDLSEEEVRLLLGDDTGDRPRLSMDDALRRGLAHARRRSASRLKALARAVVRREEAR